MKTEEYKSQVGYTTTPKLKLCLNCQYRVYVRNFDECHCHPLRHFRVSPWASCRHFAFRKP